MHLMGYLEPQILSFDEGSLAVTLTKAGHPTVPQGHPHQARLIYLNALKSTIQQRANLPYLHSIFIINL